MPSSIRLERTAKRRRVVSAQSTASRGSKRPECRQGHKYHAFQSSATQRLVKRLVRSASARLGTRTYLCGHIRPRSCLRKDRCKQQCRMEHTKDERGRGSAQLQRIRQRVSWLRESEDALLHRRRLRRWRRASRETAARCSRRVGEEILEVAHTTVVTATLYKLWAVCQAWPCRARPPGQASYGRRADSASLSRPYDRRPPRSGDKSFFASFFQKRSACFLLLP